MVTHLEDEDDFDLYDIQLEQSFVQSLTHKQEDIKLSDEFTYFKEGEN